MEKPIKVTCTKPTDQEIANHQMIHGITDQIRYLDWFLSQECKPYLRRRKTNDNPNRK